MFPSVIASQGDRGRRFLSIDSSFSLCLCGRLPMLDDVGKLLLGIAGADGKKGKKEQDEKKRRNPKTVIGNVAL